MHITRKGIAALLILPTLIGTGFLIHNYDLPTIILGLLGLLIGFLVGYAT